MATVKAAERFAYVMSVLHNFIDACDVSDLVAEFFLHEPLTSPKMLN